jgi:predicted N-acetyltransferase YhbS
MKQIHWKLFSWNLSQLHTPLPTLPAGLTLQTAERTDEAAIQSLTTRAFSSDEQWSGSYREIAEPLQIQIHETFRTQTPPAIAIFHGTRIIAASCLSTDPDAEHHLFSGPCVLHEYRSRGIGTYLLLQSLLTLRAAGIHVARALCKEGTTASKFVYPKFGSVSEPYDEDPFRSPL